MGLTRVLAAEKGADSIRNGIATLQEYRIIIHPSCRNTATEIASYAWKVDKAGHRQNQPEDKNNHLMDALRYAMDDIKGFKPGDEPPKAPRPSRTGLNASDFAGGWS